MGYVALLFLSALGVSAVAGYFSIVGLMAIFPAAAMSILAMGVVLEVAKLVTASWLYQNWNSANLLMKAYFVPAVAILSIITSMGIFGFLSKAHIDQGVESGDATAKIERLDTAIERNRREVERAQRTLDSFDATLDRYTSLGFVTRGLDARKEQKEEREAMRNIIAKAEAENDKLFDQRSELSAEVRAFEVEVGPIKYIADLIYEDGRENLEAAVRSVIIAIVLVFDPLAILLVVAANMQLNTATGKRIEFFSLDETATETASELYEKWEETKSQETHEQLQAAEKVMEENKELLAKLADGESLNPADRKKISNLEWLIDKKRK
jgi:hypothetical protein